MNLALTYREISIALGVALAAYLLLRPKEGFKFLLVVIVICVALYFIVLSWNALSTGMQSKTRMGNKTLEALK